MAGGAGQARVGTKLPPRFIEHLLCVGQACLRLIAAEHAGNLGGSGLAGYLVQVRLRNISGLLADHVMFVGHDGNLSEMGYDNHLVCSGEIRQHAREGTRRRTADTGIDLVEHQCIDAIRVTEDNLARQHDAAELAARSNAAQGARREAGTAAI